MICLSCAPKVPAMNSLERYISDTTEPSFEQDVVRKSHQHLVLVDFWAEWCGPCKALTPILEKLVDKYTGKVVLAKVNTDEQQQLAEKFGIRSLPTVFLFRNGEVVDQFMGVQPESTIDRLLLRYVVRESDKRLEQALALHDAGETERAISELKKTIVEDPDNDNPKFQLSKWLLDGHLYDEARVMLDTISRDGKEKAEFRTLNARLEFGSRSGSEQSTEDLLRSIQSDANDLEARFQLAHRFIEKQQLAEALDQLIEIIKRDKTFGNDTPRQTILKIFDLAGGKGPLVSQYRNRLAQALN